MHQGLHIGMDGHFYIENQRIDFGPHDPEPGTRRRTDCEEIANMGAYFCFLFGVIFAALGGALIGIEGGGRGTGVILLPIGILFLVLGGILCVRGRGEFCPTRQVAAMPRVINVLPAPPIEDEETARWALRR